MSREIAYRVAVPALCVWFGNIMGALHGGEQWSTAVAVPTLVTLLLVASAAGKVARGERRCTHA